MKFKKIIFAAGAFMLFTGMLMWLQLVGWQRGKDVDTMFETDAHLKRTYANIKASRLAVEVKLLRTSIGENNGNLLLPVEIRNRSSEQLIPDSTCCWSGGLMHMGPILCYATDARLVPFHRIDWEDFARTPVMPAIGLLGAAAIPLDPGEKRKFRIPLSESSQGSVVMAPIVSSRHGGPYDIQVIYVFKHRGQTQYVASPRTRIRINAPL